MTEQVRHGMTNAQIANRVGVSVDAVKFHVSNVLAKLGLTKRTELRRWSGIAKGTALNGLKSRRDDEPLMEGCMMLGQVARTVENVDESRLWYRDTLGLPELYAFPGLAFFDLGGVRLMLSEEGQGSQDSILYLRVPDLHASKEELEGRGINFTHAPHMIHRHEDGTEEWMAFFEDNDGRPLALMTQVRCSSR